MALVSREVASYPMQGAVERPPAPTLSPLPNPFLCLRLPDFLSLSLSRFAFLCLPTPPPRPYLCHTRLSFSLSLQRPPLRSLARSSVRPSKPGQLPSVFLRSRMRRITGIPPSKPKVVPSRRAFPFPPPLPTLAPRYFTRSCTEFRTAVYTKFS